MTITEMLSRNAASMHMKVSEYNPYGCGTYYTGDDKTTKGFFWYLSFNEDFAITICDFIFCSDTLMTMPDSMLYLALRLDYAAHLFPGKIMGFLEEKGNMLSAVMPAGRHVAYTEVLYIPDFYRVRLCKAFTGSGHDPIEVLKTMGREHNWSPEMMNVLIDIYRCSYNGLSAELYYVAKAYELMAELIAMGSRRLPRKDSDYDEMSLVTTYIEEHFTENVTQSKLVQLSHMSATKLKKLFRQFTGCTITNYIIDLRIDYAEHLLSETSASVEEISAASGFGSSTGFATSFRKHTGMSPSEYRKRMSTLYISDPSSVEVIY